MRSIERNGRHHRVRLDHGRWGVALYLDEVLQLSSADEGRYHAALVRPLLAVTRSSPRVVILGGGDGCAARDVLACAPTADVLVVDHEPAVLELASTEPRLVALNAGALVDRRVAVICEDAIVAIGRLSAHRFDAVIVDLTDPGHPGHEARLIERIVEQAARLVGDEGGIVVQCGSPFIYSQWAGLHSTFLAATVGRQRLSYLVEIPSFGCWSFSCAATRMPSLETVGTPSLALRT